MNDCITCKFYDSSVDCCNADENCYQVGRLDVIDKIEQLKKYYESFTHEEYYVSHIIMDLEELLEELKGTE